MCTTTWLYCRCAHTQYSSIEACGRTRALLEESVHKDNRPPNSQASSEYVDYDITNQIHQYTCINPAQAKLTQGKPRDGGELGYEQTVNASVKVDALCNRCLANNQKYGITPEIVESPGREVAELKSAELKGQCRGNRGNSVANSILPQASESAGTSGFVDNTSTVVGGNINANPDISHQFDTIVGGRPGVAQEACLYTAKILPSFTRDPEQSVGDMNTIDHKVESGLNSFGCGFMSNSPQKGIAEGGLVGTPVEAGINTLVINGMTGKISGGNGQTHVTNSEKRLKTDRVIINTSRQVRHENHQPIPNVIAPESHKHLKDVHMTLNGANDEELLDEEATRASFLNEPLGMIDCRNSHTNQVKDFCNQPGETRGHETSMQSSHVGKNVNTHRIPSAAHYSKFEVTPVDHDKLEREGLVGQRMSSVNTSLQRPSLPPRPVTPRPAPQTLRKTVVKNAHMRSIEAKKLGELHLREAARNLHRKDRSHGRFGRHFQGRLVQHSQGPNMMQTNRETGTIDRGPLGHCSFEGQPGIDRSGGRVMTGRVVKSSPHATRVPVQSQGLSGRSSSGLPLPRRNTIELYPSGYSPSYEENQALSNDVGHPLLPQSIYSRSASPQHFVTRPHQHSHSDGSVSHADWGRMHNMRKPSPLKRQVPQSSGPTLAQRASEHGCKGIGYLFGTNTKPRKWLRIQPQSSSNTDTHTTESPRAQPAQLKVARDTGSVVMTDSFDETIRGDGWENVAFDAKHVVEFGALSGMSMGLWLREEWSHGMRVGAIDFDLLAAEKHQKDLDRLAKEQEAPWPLGLFVSRDDREKSA